MDGRNVARRDNQADLLGLTRHFPQLVPPTPEDGADWVCYVLKWRYQPRAGDPDRAALVRAMRAEASHSSMATRVFSTSYLCSPVVSPTATRGSPFVPPYHQGRLRYGTGPVPARKGLTVNSFGSAMCIRPTPRETWRTLQKRSPRSCRPEWGTRSAMSPKGRSNETLPDKDAACLSSSRATLPCCPFALGDSRRGLSHQSRDRGFFQVGIAPVTIGLRAAVRAMRPDRSTLPVGQPTVPQKTSCSLGVPRNERQRAVRRTRFGAVPSPPRRSRSMASSRCRLPLSGTAPTGRVGDGFVEYNRPHGKSSHCTTLTSRTLATPTTAILSIRWEWFWSRRCFADRHCATP